MHHTQQFGLGFDEVDGSPARLIGRPKSATYRTADVVGLIRWRTSSRPCRTPADDPWHGYFRAGLAAGADRQGALGQKTKGGIFRKDGRSRCSTWRRWTIAIPLANRRRGAGHPQEQEPGRKFAQLRAPAPAGAVPVGHLPRHLPLRLPCTSKASPTMPATSTSPCAGASAGRRARSRPGRPPAGRRLPKPCATTSPPAGDERRAAAGLGVRGDCTGACMPPKARTRRPPTPSRARRCRSISARSSPSACSARNRCRARRSGKTPASACGSCRNSTRDRHPVDHQQEPRRSVATSSSACRKPSPVPRRIIRGLVIWHEAPFAFGANLKVAEGDRCRQVRPARKYVAEFQNASMAPSSTPRCRSLPPVQGMALGGGCEFLMHAAKRVIALESLHRPGRGRCRPDPGRRRLQGIRHPRRAGASEDRRWRPFEFIQPVFMTIAMANVSRRAVPRPSNSASPRHRQDRLQRHELLYIAIAEARGMAEAGYYPKLPPRGDQGCRPHRHRQLRNDARQHEGRRHDFRTTTRSPRPLPRCAAAMSRGGSLVDEQWLLTVERKLFVELLKTEKTQQRIQHMLETGKPLRN